MSPATSFTLRTASTIRSWSLFFYLVSKTSDFSVDVEKFLIVIKDVVIFVVGGTTSGLSWSLSVRRSFAGGFAGTPTSSTATSTPTTRRGTIIIATFFDIPIIFFDGFGLRLSSRWRRRLFANSPLCLHAASRDADDILLILFKQDLAEVVINITARDHWNSFLGVCGGPTAFRLPASSATTTPPSTSTTLLRLIV
jgi:hypothetical protein